MVELIDFIFVVKNNHEHNVNLKFLRNEKQFGVDNFDKLKECMSTMKKNMNDIKDLLEDLKQKNKSIVGYGSGTNFTNVMNMCGLNNNHIDYVVDTTPLKNNKWIPTQMSKLKL